MIMKKGTNECFSGKECGEGVEWDPTKTMYKSAKMKPFNLC